MLTKTFLLDGAALVIRAGYARQSMIQRRMRVGSMTAGQILWGLVDLGVVAEAAGTGGARDILVPTFDRDAIAQAIDKAAAAGRITLDDQEAGGHR